MWSCSVIFLRRKGGLSALLVQYEDLGGSYCAKRGLGALAVRNSTNEQLLHWPVERRFSSSFHPAVTSQLLQGKNARQECPRENIMCMFSLPLISKLGVGGEAVELRKDFTKF